jgi:hypothetical protein
MCGAIPGAFSASCPPSEFLTAVLDLKDNVRSQLKVCPRLPL